MAESLWALSPEQLKDVEKSHREFMAEKESKPIRLSLNGTHLRSHAENIAAEMLERYGDHAEEYFAGAFMAAESNYRRMSLQPGTTKQVNGKTYTLNENHRWTVKGQDQGSRQQAAAPDWRNQKPGLQGGTPFGEKVPEGTFGEKQKPQGDDWRNQKPGLQGGTPFGEKVPEDTFNEPNIPPYHKPNVEADDDGDGVTDAARVGVPAWDVPPPPKRIPRIPNLQGKAREAEDQFATEFENDPDKATDNLLKLFQGVSDGGPVTFETDMAKELSPYWRSKELDSNLEERSKNRATLNTALHQTANAVTKRAFLKHLDTLPEGSEIMVTVGGCGAGKGYSLKMVPEALEYKNRASVVWDSAGDQNATENPWILAEAQKRGLTASFVFVHADPFEQWANPERGVVKRAQDPNNGRMVDARVFADSYAIGARNHQAFFQLNRDNPNAQFVFLKNGNPPELLNGIPPESLSVNRKQLSDYAVKIVNEREGLPNHIKEGALQGQSLWKD